MHPRLTFLVQHPLLRHVQEDNIPMLRQRIRTGSRWFAGLIVILIASWSLFYIKIVIPEADSAFTYIMILFMGLLYGAIWIDKLAPYWNALFITTMLTHDLMWVVTNQLSNITEVYSHNTNLSLLGVIALFVPMRPTYIITYGLIMTELLFLTICFSTGAIWPYLIIQVLLGLLFTGAASLASQLQRVTYRQLHQDEQRIRSQDRLLSMGERTEQIAAQLYKPLEIAQHTHQQVWTLIEQAYNIPREQQHQLLQQARTEHQKSMRALTDTSQLIHSLQIHQNQHSPEPTHTHNLHDLWHQAGLGQGNHNITLVSQPPEMMLDGDKTWLHHMLSHIEQWWATYPHEHDLEIHATYTPIGVQLTLSSPVLRENPMQGVQHALHLCQDIVEGIFSGSLFWDQPQQHLIIVLPQVTSAAYTLDASFLPAFAPSPSSPRA